MGRLPRGRRVVSIQNARPDDAPGASAGKEGGQPADEEAPAALGDEAGGGGGSGSRDSPYQGYDMQRLAGWVEHALPFSLLLLGVFICQHLQGTKRRKSTCSTNPFSIDLKGTANIHTVEKPRTVKNMGVQGHVISIHQRFQAF